MKADPIATASTAPYVLSIVACSITLGKIYAPTMIISIQIRKNVAVMVKA